MSFVWNVMLFFSTDEYWRSEEDEARDHCESLNAINKRLPAGCKLVDLTKPTFKEKNGYGMEANVYGGGFKHFDIEDFIELVAAQPWQDPDNVQLFLKAESAEHFTVHFPCRAKRKRKRQTPSS